MVEPEDESSRGRPVTECKSGEIPGSEIRDEAVAAWLTIVTGCRALEEVLKRSIVRLVFPETPVKFQGS